eukprot:403351637
MSQLIEKEDILKQFKRRFKTLKVLGRGSFGSVYEVLDYSDNLHKALKVQKSNELSRSELKLMQSLNKSNIQGVPKYYDMQQISDKEVVLLLGLQGPSLYDILEQNKMKSFPIQMVAKIAIGTIKILKSLHSLGYVHCDLKPNNILLAKDLCYQDIIVENELSQEKAKNICGNKNFMSLNHLKGYNQSRRDDMESLFYNLLYLAKGEFPWTTSQLQQGLVNRSAYYYKENYRSERLFKNMPDQFNLCFNHIKQLSFEERPDYKFLIDQMTQVMQGQTLNHGDDKTPKQIQNSPKFKNMKGLSQVSKMDSGFQSQVRSQRSHIKSNNYSNNDRTIMKLCDKQYDKHINNFNQDDDGSAIKSKSMFYENDREISPQLRTKNSKNNLDESYIQIPCKQIQTALLIIPRKRREPNSKVSDQSSRISKSQFYKNKKNDAVSNKSVSMKNQEKKCLKNNNKDLFKEFFESQSIEEIKIKNEVEKDQNKLHYLLQYQQVFEENKDINQANHDKQLEEDCDELDNINELEYDETFGIISQNQPNQSNSNNLNKLVCQPLYDQNLLQIEEDRNSLNNSIVNNYEANNLTAQYHKNNQNRQRIQNLKNNENSNTNNLNKNYQLSFMVQQTPTGEKQEHIQFSFLNMDYR